MLRFSWRKQEYVIPIMLMYSLHTVDQCLEYLGGKFRVVLGMPEDWTNTALGLWLIQKLILVHLESPREKHRMLL
jgi:DNA-directed RNA polymerase I subunit RPA2